MPGLSYPTGDAVSRLMLARGNALAEGQAQRGQLWGGALANVGAAAARTVSDLVRYQEDAPLRQLRQQEVVKATRENDQETAIGGAMTASNGDPDLAMRFLENAGNGDALMALRTRVSDWRQKQATALKDSTELANTQFTRAQQLMSTVPILKDDAGQFITSGPEYDKAATAYTAVVPKVRELVGDQLGKMLPDAYDPQFMEQAQTWGETQAQHLERLRLAASAASDAVQKSKSVREADEYWTKSLSAASGTWGSDEDRQHFLGIAKNLGASPETLQKFSDPWSPEAQKKWATLGLTPAEVSRAGDVTPGSKEDVYASYAKQFLGGRPASTMTLAEKASADKYYREHSGEDNGSLVQVTEPDPDDPGQTRIVLRPKVEGMTVRTTNADDATLPRGVKEYIVSLARKAGADGKTPLTFEQAQADLASTWPSLVKDHPRLDPVKADSALREIFRPAPGSGQQAFADVLAGMMNGGKAPAPKATVPAATAPAVTSPAATAPAKTTVQVGQRVKARDGQWYVVGEVFPDGSWNPK